MKNRRGFTFLELMLALVIVAIVAGAVAVALKTAFTAKDSIINSLEPARQANTAIEFIRRDLESALPPVSQISNQFIGNPIDDAEYPSHDLWLCAAVDAPHNVLTTTDVRLVEYIMQADDSNNHVLLRRVTSNLLPVDGNYPASDDEVLCRGVRSFAIKYYDGTQDPDPSTWLDTWDSTQVASNLGGATQTNILPYAIQVTLQLDPVKPGGKPTTITRILQLPCAVPASQPAGTTP
jgi:prepilin-type N-terminal cleavage/methylation domain-containing protein